jgi:hypothetical protein
VTKLFLGIDPGSVNLGWGLVTANGVTIDHGHFNPSSLSFEKTVDTVVGKLPSTCVEEEGCVTIERYVAYKGVTNQASEQILMLIGALVYEFSKRGREVYLLRAIDWKSNLCKHMFKTQGFRNPSKSFDKKYSMAMAEALSGIKLESDHEADAICLAYYNQREICETV